MTGSIRIVFGLKDFPRLYLKRSYKNSFLRAAIGVVCAEVYKDRTEGRGQMTEGQRMRRLED